MDNTEVADTDVADETGMARCLARIAELARLADGWHDGHGLAPREASVATARALLAATPDLVDTYSIYPTDGGGLLLEFVRMDWSYSIEVNAEGGLELDGIPATLEGGSGYITSGPAQLDSPAFVSTLDLLRASWAGSSAPGL